MCHKVWASREQPAPVRVLSAAGLLNRSCFPWVEGGEHCEILLWPAHGAASSTGGKKPLSSGEVAAALWVPLTTALQFWNLLVWLRDSLSSLPFFVHLTSFCILSTILYFSVPAFSVMSTYASIQAYYLHGGGSASMQKPLWTLILRDLQEDTLDSHFNMKMSLLGTATHFGLSCLMQSYRPVS